MYPQKLLTNFGIILVFIHAGRFVAGTCFTSYF